MQLEFFFFLNVLQSSIKNQLNNVNVNWVNFLFKTDIIYFIHNFVHLEQIQLFQIMNIFDSEWSES